MTLPNVYVHKTVYMQLFSPNSVRFVSTLNACKRPKFLQAHRNTCIRIVITQKTPAKAKYFTFAGIFHFRYSSECCYDVIRLL